MNITTDHIIFVTALSLAIVIVIGIVCYLILLRKKREEGDAPVSHKIKRHHANPIMSPRPHQEWETNGTFNPTAIEDDEGRVHLLYRAIGNNGLSNIGHASSIDGMNFDRRSPFPVYQPHVEEKNPSEKKSSGPAQYNPAIYTSGGGWGGHEDPRAVKIGSRVYMTYTAFQGWGSVRIGLTSIAVKDLKKERWNWKKPRLISPPDEVHKNWVLFPEKVNGKYAILHGIVPKIMIEYVDDLDETFPHIKSSRPQGPQPGREGFWDNILRGAGPPPIKTNRGWLLLYHAVDRKEFHKYKLGAMILDANDPTRILYRAPEPILTPDMCYENDGKPGIVYASGAIVRDGQLLVYYGGGDRHVCIAQTPLDVLLDWLVTYGKHTGQENVV
ncbi:MAG: hypothetical protein A3C79_00510 [Candidatus Taylorbacteria bacterium RIFCSPHIGHO2_02_FULL_45_28]|uniref:Glycosidase n=1 Tax=Candidatus Taylorbacteria bacterium RIFCSPHIGHO2_12_FULL_45_16 TaxID=1802315 RepID=A0A1G2MZA4_9BACT|nr:MAG: hypothetical protein A2830_01765 [Candidatus Taylorbacteria bacterium RIFCSPHIGHO2_01_FULL_44_110]OHA25503.1 MAG: hypothetical protein A3C79_00510 [Candidatus Taylorbacteria bacterium RIFCSPHIGHO2_02_FULL_45_28]OHA29170.1 MAG: hypothetical protein A3F51_00975 [Candidatus Taylorbacteria bacterium RIFCSPHIGHO2_12_FULL_45_16]OHA33392.1 MAG: hypothetical protein A3A23_01855 [Candidatus Taylorbacteria bacterium RIFCSPLOWO2_01_FULL_45_59]OHA39478.1 MAG: hypothetical protein A3I98_03825 [Candi